MSTYDVPLTTYNESIEDDISQASPMSTFDVPLSTYNESIEDDISQASPMSTFDVPLSTYNESTEDYICQAGSLSTFSVNLSTSDDGKNPCHFIIINEVNQDRNSNKEEKEDHIDFEKIPLRALNGSCRRQLSLALLQERLLPTSSGYARDWQGLCELAGFDYDLIHHFKSKNDPVDEMLKYWTKYQPSVAKLLEYLEVMERFDVIIDIEPMIEKDALAYIKKREREGRGDLSISPSTTSTFSVPPSTSDDSSDMYDAYVSYIDSDADFVSQMIAEMEVNFKLRLFIKGRDMLAGVGKLEDDLCLINQKCEKILLIVSQESLNDAHCEFHAFVAQAAAVDSTLYARKLIPIICKPCELPSRFKYLARLDYTKKDLFNGFWRRLYWSIKGQMPDGFTPTTGGYIISSVLSPEPTVTNTGPLLNFRLITSSPEILIPHESPSKYPRLTTKSLSEQAIRLSPSLDTPTTPNSGKTLPLPPIENTGRTKHFLNSLISSKNKTEKSPKSKTDKSPLPSKRGLLSFSGRKS